ncbi:MAG: hypothetical protein HFG66_05490 [Hungatella sp.]|nr:hypothetical protein [Hungatella sp.]
MTQYLQHGRAGCPFPLKSSEQIFKDLEISHQQAAAGDYQDARAFISEVRKEYEI